MKLAIYINNLLELLKVRKRVDGESVRLKKSNRLSIWKYKAIDYIVRIMHISLIKLLPITILGIAIAYAVYKTKSIFAGMLIHFLNNGFAVLATSKLTQPSSEIMQAQQYGTSMIWMGLVIGVVAILIMFLGIRLISYKN